MSIFRRDTPFGPFSTWIDGSLVPDGLPLGGPAVGWTTDELEVSLTAAIPDYGGTTFDVDGHFGWLWRITVRRDIPQLRIVARLDPDRRLDDLTAEPFEAPWLRAVKWQRGETVVGTGTSDLEALLVRSADGNWLPERYLDAVDPTNPGMVPFIERTAVGITATFIAPRAGECFGHHVSLAWADERRLSPLVDALEIEADGILRGAARESSG
ncbi:MAG TPA: hypothetical protein PLV41_05800 [Miltoncostaeales bacterium]|nr:hypothetical protein [Miltoncostaeales bacterium]